MTTVREKNWLKYFKDPNGVGPLENADAVGQAGGGCNDLVRLFLRIENNVIKEASFLASGCPGAIAGAAACVELVSGKSILKAASFNSTDISRVLEDIPVERENCLELSSTALSMALESYASMSSTELTSTGRVLAAMSGGVDSSTAAVMLHRQFEVLGVTLRLHDYASPGPRTCCTSADINDARRVAHSAGFPHLIIDMRDQFKAEVVDRFCREYLSGRTPNPCVDCNRRVRFTHLLNKAHDLGASKVATGHYVRILGPNNEGRYKLRRAVDRSKDQSYMFWAADQNVLSSFLTPLGELTKKSVRETAAANDLTVAAKPDSQDVCFVPDGDYAGFVGRFTGHSFPPGPIVDSADRRLGEHKGLVHYTVGQRKGLGISAAEPLYVLKLDVESNRLIVGKRGEQTKKRFEIYSTNFIESIPSSGTFTAGVMTRYNCELKQVAVTLNSENTATVEFEKPFGPIAPGQSAVFYDGELVLGGGIIA